MPLSFTVEELGKLTGADIVGNASHIISGIESLEEAKAHEASFLENPRYENLISKSEAGVIFLSSRTPLVEGKNFLIVDQPSLAFQKVIELFLSPAQTGFSGIHKSCVIHEEAQLGQGVRIGPYAVIDRLAVIGDRCVIGAGVYIGPETTLGQDCLIHPHVVIHDRSILGNRVILQSGCVIGSSGFGYATDQEGQHTLLQQLGRVVIEDEVEIGSNTTIDRARFKETRIGRGTKIDNLVQIAHQVHLGENNLIVAQVGIAGSTKTGKNVVLAGQAALVGHISIADNVVLAARGAASKSILKSGVYSGAPATPIKEFNEQVVYIRNLKKLVKRLDELEVKVIALLPKNK